MSTHVTIVKKPSNHNLQVTVKNPGDAAPFTHVLQDYQAAEVMVHGGVSGGTIELRELDKDPALSLELRVKELEERLATAAKILKASVE